MHSKQICLVFRSCITCCSIFATNILECIYLLSFQEKKWGKSWIWPFFTPLENHFIQMVKIVNTTLQMFAGIYRDFAGKSEWGDFKFTGIACIPAIPVIFEVNQKKGGLFINTLY